MSAVRAATDTVRKRHAARAEGEFVPRLYRVIDRRRETEDVVTMILEAMGRPIAEPEPGQFNMLTAFGVGEIAISSSASPGRGTGALLRHTIRDVGAVSHALCRADCGSVVGVRGPFGRGWSVDDLGASDAVVVAGGIGLAPLYGAVERLVERQRSGRGRCYVAIGARTPDQLLFGDDLARWRALGATVLTTVDAADPSWTGAVGVVTELLPQLPITPERAVAFVCGPEIMIRFTARNLIDRGLAAQSVRVSLERNMQCGIGLCGHCQLGPYLLCRDGPVVPFVGVVPELLSGDER